MNKKLLPAYLLTFVNVLGFSILMPVLPFIVEHYGAPEWVFGLMLTFYSASQFVGSPWLGAMSDQRGRKPVLMISQAGTLLSWFVFLGALFLPNTSVYGLAIPLLIIGLSRILDGITGGNASVANAYVADITTPEQKSYIFGYLGGIAGIGLIIGPGIGGLTAGSSFGYKGTILTAIGISTIALIAIKFWLKESLPQEKRLYKARQSISKSFFILRRIREVQPKPIIKTLFIIKLFFSVMMAFYISSISLFLIDLFSFDEKELGFFMLFVGIFLSFNQAFLSKRFINAFGQYKTLLIGLSLSVIGLICITLTDILYLYIAFYYVMNLGLSLCFPTFNGLIAQHANPQRQGEIMGISESINSLALALFPVIGAGLYGIIGYKMYYFMALLPLAGLLIAVVRGKRDIEEAKKQLSNENPFAGLHSDN
jgi:DHA1 family tetracycline resistance protein-like MFS transporter